MKIKIENRAQHDSLFTVIDESKLMRYRDPVRAQRAADGLGVVVIPPKNNLIVAGVSH